MLTPKDIGSWPAKARAEYYRHHAAQLLVLAEGEPINGIRDKLIELAAQYQKLSNGLLQSN